MKDKKFLELLNLYLDGELDPAGAVELEQEVLANPTRRRVYNDYCRIHRATKLVYEQFSAAGAAPAGVDPLPSSRPLIALEAATGTIALDGRTGGRAARRPFRAAVFATGLAAACAVGVFIGSGVLAPPAAPETNAAVAAPAEPKAAAPAAVATTQPARPAATNVIFAAPFAPEFRTDPFVQPAPVRADPFALSSWLGSEVESMPQLPDAVLPTPRLRLDPSLRPAAQGFESGRDEAATSSRNPFRLRVKSQPTVEPANDFSVRQ